jgi:hypothetical protein
VSLNLIVYDSTNMKTGPVDVSIYRAQCTCPSWCPLWGHGCYAENRGKAGPFGHASRGRASNADVAAVFSALPAGSKVRLNVSGDYLDDAGEPDMSYIEATNLLSGRGIMVLSYTHAWQALDPKWFADDVRPNASCDTLLGIGQALNAGWPAVIVDPHQDDRLYPQGMDLYGLKAVTCLFETPRKTQCIECGLCARGKRRSVVVFPVHGARKKAATAALEALA